MARAFSRALILGGLAFLPASPLWGADESYATMAHLIERVERLEKRFAASMLDFSSRDQRLQDELQALRGEVEDLGHRLQMGTAPPSELQAASAPGAAGQVPPPLPAPPVSAVTPVPPAEGKVEDVRMAYQKAFAVLKEGRYADAVGQLRQFQSAHADSEFGDDAQYWLGEALLMTRDLNGAREAFQKLIESYPQSAKVPDAGFKLGVVEYDAQQWAAARKQFEDVRARFPGSRAAASADSHLQKMKQERR